MVLRADPFVAVTVNEHDPFFFTRILDPDTAHTERDALLTTIFVAR